MSSRHKEAEAETKAEKHLAERVEAARAEVVEAVSLMHRCLVCVVLVLLIGIASYVVVYRLGLPEALDKLQLAAIPAAVLGVLTSLFIWLNRECWLQIKSRATLAHFFFWLIIVTAFIYAALRGNTDLMITVYLFGFGLPVMMLSLVKGQCKPLDYSLLLGIHGGVGAYALVMLTLWLLEHVHVPFTVVTASQAPTCTIVPYDLLASFTAQVLPPAVVLLIASFVEEVMFRLPLALFKKYGMYTVGFLVSFLFVYLHVFGYMHLEPEALLQVLTCIACANAMFIAVYTRTLNLWSSVIAHLLYNVLVLAKIPLVVALAALLVNGIIHILLVRAGIVESR